MRDGKLCGHPAADRYREELDVASGVDLARRCEEYVRAIRGESERDVIPRVPRQPLRDSPLGRDDIDVRVPLVSSGEGDPLPVGREAGPRFDAGMRRQPPYTRAIEVRHPDVVRICEGDTVAADRGIGEKTGVVDVDREERKCGQHEDG